MPIPIAENLIEEILEKFDYSISEYEIIDMEEYKGWSSEYLYLIVSASDNFVLKAKTLEQTAGYDNEVKVSFELINNKVPSRLPIITKKGTLFHEQYGYHWCLMTYIPGAASHITEYNEKTVKSLAKHIDQYIVSAVSGSSLANLKLNESKKKSELSIITRLYSEKAYLEEKGFLNIAHIDTLYSTLIDGHNKFLKDLKVESIIHNDINPRNILIDHKSKEVVSLIDWDHVKYGNPLKDLSDAVTMFYDYFPIEVATSFRDTFYNSFNSKWYTGIKTEAVEYAFLFYYTVSKWRAILFYLDLLREYDNKYGEKEKFINEIKQNYSKWVNTITSVTA